MVADRRAYHQLHSIKAQHLHKTRVDALGRIITALAAVPWTGARAGNHQLALHFCKQSV